MSRCVENYPEHLNPFDDNYNGVPEEEMVTAGKSKKKYNTWTANRGNKVGSTVAKTKTSFLDKPWAALNVSPSGKIGRRLSIIKTTVERFAVKQKLLSRSSSFSNKNNNNKGPQRSNSVHNDFSFRIVSPKVKERLRQQAFSPNIDKLEVESDPVERPNTPEVNVRLSEPVSQTQKTENLESDSKRETCEPACIQGETKFNSSLGARPKSRKKKPPPPPPQETPKTVTLEITNCDAKSEDCQSANSSITQELEKYASSEEDSSLTETELQQTKNQQPTNK